jgi:hypothetical protein
MPTAFTINSVGEAILFNVVLGYLTECTISEFGVAYLTDGEEIEHRRNIFELLGTMNSTSERKT